MEPSRAGNAGRYFSVEVSCRQGAGATDWSTAFRPTLLVYNRVVQEDPMDEGGECG